MPAAHQKLYRSVLDVLLNSAEPSIQWKVRAGVLNEDPRSKDMRALREEVRNSARVRTLLPHRDKKGRVPGREQVLDCWLHRQFYTEFEVARKADAYKKRGVPVMQGRHRRCAPQQGYALYFLLRLGLESERVHDLVERLLHWRWPDGGWN